MVRVTFRSTRVSGRRCGSYWSRGRSYDRTTGVVLRGTRKFVDSPLEGTGFEPSVPLLRKAILGIGNRRWRHERRSHSQVQARDGNASLEWLLMTFPFVEGLAVRIRFPPAESHANSRSQGGSRTVSGSIVTDDARLDAVTSDFDFGTNLDNASAGIRKNSVGRVAMRAKPA